jgi:hypothetical protein
MLTKFTTMLALGLLPTVSSPLPPSGQSALLAIGDPVATSASDSVQLSYRLSLDGRDAAGQYNWSGTIEGRTHGQAAVQLSFRNEPSVGPGLAPVQTRWLVLATQDSRSFEATLNGTIDMVSGRAHLIGVIVAGAGRGQRVETYSQLFNFGVHAALSESSGTMSIAAAPAKWARARPLD